MGASTPPSAWAAMIAWLVPGCARGTERGGGGVWGVGNDSESGIDCLFHGIQEP